MLFEKNGEAWREIENGEVMKYFGRKSIGISNNGDF